MRRCRAVQGAYGPLHRFAAITAPPHGGEHADEALRAPPAGTIKSHRPMTVYRASPANGHFFAQIFKTGGKWFIGKDAG